MNSVSQDICLIPAEVLHTYILPHVDRGHGSELRAVNQAGDYRASLDSVPAIGVLALLKQVHGWHSDTQANKQFFSHESDFRALSCEHGEVERAGELMMSS